jgi:hypothetical protein
VARRLLQWFPRKAPERDLTGGISIVGSTNRGDAQTQADARVAAYHLGRALAKAGLPILVYHDDAIFIKAEVVRGYLDSGSAAVNSIEVRCPEKVDENNVPNPPPFAKYQGHPSFMFHPDKHPEWEISFYRSLEEIGGMLVLQGGSSTLIAGLISINPRPHDCQSKKSGFPRATLCYIRFTHKELVAERTPHSLSKSRVVPTNFAFTFIHAKCCTCSARRPAGGNLAQ